MFAAPHKAASLYRAIHAETAVSHANPHGLILMLYDALLAELAHASTEKDAVKRTRALAKAQRLIEEGLRVGLDFNAPGGLAQNLDLVYEHCTLRLAAAMTDSAAKLSDVVVMIRGLRDAWAQIPPSVRANPRAALAA
jgi:flagellar secretion chaperone FliS